MKTNRLTLRRSNSIFAVAIVAMLSVGRAFAAPFISGNIAVLQAGDGTAPLSGVATPQFVLEYLPATPNQGGPVQTITIPAAGPSRLLIAGNATSEGHIAISLDTSNLTFQGYDADLGVGSISSSSANGTNRCVGQLDANGNFTRTATGTSTEFTTGSIRSTISDGSNYWMSGSGSSAGEGIWYSANGETPSQIQSGVNTRVTRIFNGKLFFTTAAALSGYSGVPTSAATATATGITGSSLYEFAINPAGNVAYVCDDSALGASAGGIAKWTNNGSTWNKAFTFGSTNNTATNGLTAGCRSLVVDFSGGNPVIYATTADTPTKLIKLTDTSAVTATSDNADQAIVLAVAPANTAFRGVAFAPSSASTGTAPVITGINPSSVTNSTGATVTFTLTGGVGFPAASNFWYKIVGSTTNLISGAKGPGLTLTNLQPSDTALYFAILTNEFGSATSGIASLTVISKPNVTAIAPTNLTVFAGSSVTFTLTATTGNPVASNFWYKVVGPATNLIPAATGTNLTLNNVLAGDTATYFAILTNSSGSSTSPVASLTVTGDPHIAVQPVNASGLLGGVAQFGLSAIGTTPLSYQWYFSDTNGNIVAPVSDGNSTMSGLAFVTGANASTLTVSNLQSGDPTNFLAVVANGFGSVTSSVASLLSVTNTGILAFWDFNGPEFTNTAINPNSINHPAPFVGLGTASAVGSCFFPTTSPFSGSVDPNDGLGFTSHLPPFSWGSSHYPLTGGNKQNGVQFNLSTVGAKDIRVSYESRVSATASDYERLQYTTNGTDWTDYPSSSTFNGIGTTYLPFQYDLTGFPGVANNPSFGIRVVTEYQQTATYGIGTTNGYVGTANSYSSGGSGGFAAGTVTYDLVTISGDAITNKNMPPVVSSFADTNVPDFTNITVNFTVSDDSTPPDSLAYSAVSLNSATVSPAFVFGGSGASRTLTIIPNNPIPDQIDAAPILVRVTDADGDSTATWFTLTVTAVNLAPTNSLTTLAATNTLANTPLTIPFSVGDDRTPAGGITYTVASGNNTVIPSGNIVVTPNGSNPTLTITPAVNQLGVANISVTASDNDAQEPRHNTAVIAVMVRPNTNVVAIDYFNYDNGGALDAVSGGFWQHLSGNFGQMQVNSGVVTVDTLDNTENLQTPLLNAPYQTNSGTVLYSSFIVNLNDPLRQPRANGTYFAAFNDGSGNTARVEGLVVVATNGTAPGNYRLGIANIVGATATNAQMFPQDLAQGTNYVVVTALVLSNGFSTIWVNPWSQSSASVTDTTPATAATNLYAVSDYELRESGSNGGSVSVSRLKVGTTFDSVFPSLHIRSNDANVILDWSDPTLKIQSATNVFGPYQSVSGAVPPHTNGPAANPTMFFRFGQ
jgi:hypothetical protein